MKPAITFDKESFDIALDAIRKNIISSFLILCAFSVINVLLFFSGTQSMVVTILLSVCMPSVWLVFILLVGIQRLKGVYVLKVNEKDPAVLQLITREDMLKEEIALYDDMILRLEHHMIREATLTEFRENTSIDQKREDKRKLTELISQRKLLLSELEGLGMNYVQTLEAKTA